MVHACVSGQYSLQMSGNFYSILLFTLQLSIIFDQMRVDMIDMTYIYSELCQNWTPSGPALVKEASSLVADNLVKFGWNQPARDGHLGEASTLQGCSL